MHIQYRLVSYFMQTQFTLFLSLCLYSNLDFLVALMYTIPFKLCYPNTIIPTRDFLKAFILVYMLQWILRSTLDCI